MILLQDVAPATQTVSDSLIFLLFKKQLSKRSGWAEQLPNYGEIIFLINHLPKFVKANIWYY